MKRQKLLCSLFFVSVLVFYFVFFSFGDSLLGEKETIVEGKGTLRILSSTECVFEVPENPTRVLFAAPGCKHTALDWWDRGPNCPHCTGLPEEKRIVSEALSRNWAVLVCSPKKICWKSGDSDNIKPAIDEFMASHGLKKKPIFAFGVSSGGYFLHTLMREIELKGVIIEVMMLGDTTKWPTSLYYSHPPTVFSFMSEDYQTKEIILQQAIDLKAKYIPVKLIELSPLPIKETFFSDRIQGISVETSTKLGNELVSLSLLTEERFLIDNPREVLHIFHAEFKKIVEEGGVNDSIIPDQSPILEELNVAFARHEISADPIVKAFDFLEMEERVRGREDRR